MKAVILQSAHRIGVILHQIPRVLQVYFSKSGAENTAMKNAGQRINTVERRPQSATMLTVDSTTATHCMMELFKRQSGSCKGLRRHRSVSQIWHFPNTTKSQGNFLESKYMENERNFSYKLKLWLQLSVFTTAGKYQHSLTRQITRLFYGFLLYPRLTIFEFPDSSRIPRFPEKSGKIGKWWCTAICTGYRHAVKKSCE